MVAGMLGSSIEGPRQIARRVAAEKTVASSAPRRKRRIISGEAAVRCSRVEGSSLKPSLTSYLRWGAHARVVGEGRVAGRALDRRPRLWARSRLDLGAISARSRRDLGAI
jgi:hypothetical protein